MVRRIAKGAAALLALFHVWLLVRHAWTGQLVDAALIARWIVAAGLVGALMALRRQGASMFVSRKAIAVWLLAAALHGPSIASRLDMFNAPALPEAAVTLAAAAAAVAAIALGLVFLFLTMRRRQPVGPGFIRIASGAPGLGAVALRTLVLVAPRPPPLA